ncbi:hypothetical protein BUALT_Bualt19G0118600 [Buddleja alternifolia]|uniref:DUF4408 domain-containing protein n=1 Tax=Buddleja alternifolia TaxID=168488 RepID=A0AAV6W9I5_9LAMI|nr:hypothetical protein BUALT_Bualt19G0118600 [Buddleja alternifolia]
MDSFNFRDIRVEKSNAISRYRRGQRITTLFRCLELFVFLVIVSRFSTQFAFSLELEYFRGIAVTLISPRFVFLIGNAIVIVLFVKSRQFSSKNGEIAADLYEEYAEKCRKNLQSSGIKVTEESKGSNNYRSSVCCDDRKMQRSQSEKLERIVRVEERRRELRRSTTERCRKSEDEMSGDEFRRTVEAFIARQQRFLREEEDFSAVVSLIGT